MRQLWSLVFGRLPKVVAPLRNAFSRCGRPDPAIEFLEQLPKLRLQARLARARPEVLSENLVRSLFGPNLVDFIDDCTAKRVNWNGYSGVEVPDNWIVYGSADRKAVFVGDLINRGPAIGETLEIVKAWSMAGSAICAMGNHELNALAFHTPNGNGSYIRPHTN